MKKDPGELKRLAVTHVVYHSHYDISHNGNTIHTQIQNTGGLCSFRYERVYWLLASVHGDTKERDIILTKLPHPNSRRIVWCLRSLSVEIRKTQLHLSTVKIQLSTAEYPTLASMVQSQLMSFQNPQIHGPISISQLHSQTSTSQHHGRTPTSQLHGWTSTKSFSKSSKFSAHLLRAWHHPHSSRISCLGVYYDRWWLSYLLRMTVTAPNDYAPGLKRDK